MKKNLLLSLVAASAPMVAFADASVGLQMSKDKWGTQQADQMKTVTIENDVIVSSNAAHVHYKIKLAPGVYKVIQDNTKADNSTVVIANSTDWHKDESEILAKEGVELKIEKETEVYIRVCAVTGGVKFSASGVRLVFVTDFDFAKVAKAFDNEAVFDLSKVDKAKYPKVAEELQNEATRIKGEILKIKEAGDIQKSPNGYALYLEYYGKKEADYAKTELWQQIQNLKKKISDAANVTNVRTYAVEQRDAVITLLNDVSFKAPGDAKDNVYAKVTKGYDKERQALLEGVKKAFEGVDAYESDPNFTKTFSKENVDKIVKDYTAKKDALQANIKKAIQNDKAYNAIVPQVEQVKNAYLAKQKELTALMNANEGQKENVYEGLLQQATVKLADASRLVTNTAFNTMLGSKDLHDTALENQQKMQDEIDKANATINKTVADYTKWYNDEAAAYKAQMSVVDGKNKLLVAYDKDTEETKALRKTAADAIAAFKQVLVDQNKAWNLAKYAGTAEYNAQVSDIDAKIKAYTDKVGLDKTNFTTYTTLVENLAGLDKKLAEAKAAVAKMTYDKDGYKYNAANQNNTNAIDGKEGSLTEAKAKVGDAYQAGTKYELAWVNVKTIEGDIASYQKTAQASFDAYKVLAGNLAADKKAAAELKDLVGKEGFVKDAAGKTYDVIVAEVEKKIADTAKPLADALAKQNVAHQNALKGIYASQKDDIAGLKTQFAKDKAEYIKNTNINDAIQLRDAAQAVVDDINAKVKEADKAIQGTGTKKDAFTKELEVIQTEVKKYQGALDNYKTIDENNSLEASAALGKVQKVTLDLQTQINTLLGKVNEQVKVVKAEQNFLKGLRAADGALGKLKVTIDKIKTANKDASRNAEFEGLYNQVNALYEALDKEANDSCVKEVLQARWVEYYKEKDAKGNAIRGLKGRCMDIQVDADKHVKAAEASTANWKAYNAVKTLVDDLKFVTADGKGSIAVAREQITNGVVVPGQKQKQAITGAAKTFYLAEIAKAETTLADLKKQIETSYGEGKREMVAKQASYEKSLNDLSDKLNNMPSQAAQNEVAHNDLVKKSAGIDKKLNEVITYVSENDKTSMRDEYLNQLTAQQKALIDEDKLVANEWENGTLYDKLSTRDGEYNAISKEIEKIEYTQKNDYSKVVLAENQAYFDKFQAEYNSALAVHKVAVSKIEAYLNLKHENLRNAVRENAKKHEVEIYDEMKLAKNLKATFEEAYAKNSSTGLVFEFPEETSFNTLHGHLTKIQGFTVALQADAETNAKNFLDTEIADADALLIAAQNDLKSKNFATWESAFADVKDNIKAAKEFKVEKDGDYAIALDGTKHFENLEATSSNLRSGKETAADAEWAYFLKHDKVDLKADLNNWKAAVGYYDSYWQSYTDGTFVYPETEESQKRQDQRDFSAQFDTFDSYKDFNVSYYNVVGYKQNAQKAYDAAKGVYDRAASMVQQKEKSDAAYDLLFKGVSGKDKFANNFASLDEKKAELDAYAVAYNISKYASWQGQMSQFENEYSGYKYLKSQIESAKRSGTIHNALDNYKKQMNAYADKLDKTQVAVSSLYKVADNLQEKQLEEDLEMLKKEINRAVANSSHTIDFYDGLREKLAQYFIDFDAAKKLAGYQAKTDKVAEATPKHDAFAVLEGKIAADLQEVRASYDIDNDFNSENEKVNDRIKSLMNDYNRLNELVESQDTHKAVQDYYAPQRDEAKQVLDEMNAYVDAHRDTNNKVLYYYLNSVKQEIDKGEGLSLSYLISNLKNDEKAWDNHEARYARVKSELQKYETYFNDVVCAELNTYQSKYENRINQIQNSIVREMTWLDANSTGNNEYVFNGHGIDNGIYSDIYNLQNQAAQQEYNDRKSTIDNLISSVETNLNKFLLTDADVQEYTGLLTSYMSLNQKMDTYHSQLVYDWVSVDIDGNDVRDYYGHSIYRPYVVLDGEEHVQNYQEVHKRANELIEKTNALLELLNENQVVRGDANKDKSIDVADYMKVLGWILEDADMKAEVNTMDVREQERFLMRVDANADGMVNIGDVVNISNKIRGINTNKKMLVMQPFSLHARQIDNIALSASGEGTSRRIAISLNNSINYVGCQMDITLPEGVTLVGESVADRASSHDIYSSDLENGKHRIVVSSTNNDLFAGDEGAVIYLDVEVSHNYKGDGVIVSDVMFSDPGSQVYHLNSIAGGEATGIGTVTLTEELKSKVYNVGGQLMNGLKKGVNILKMNDGSVKKVIKK